MRLWTDVSSGWRRWRRRLKSRAVVVARQNVIEVGSVPLFAWSVSLLTATAGAPLVSPAVKHRNFPSGFSISIRIFIPIVIEPFLFEGMARPLAMHSLQESFASWATILGTGLRLVGLIQSRAWLTGTSLLFVFVSIIVGLYAWRGQLIVNSAAVKVEGRSIDSLNIAKLRRRVNQSLVIQEAATAEIDGEDLKITWKYSGIVVPSKKSHGIQHRYR